MSGVVEVGNLTLDAYSDLSYVGEGACMYAFAIDQDMVIKLFKTPAGIHSKFLSWGVDLDRVTWISDEYQQKHLSAARYKYISNMRSYEIALRHADITGVTKTHFSVDDSLPSQIRVGQKTYDATRMPYVVQKRCTTVKEELVGLIQQNKVDEAKQTLDQVLELILAMWSRGITDNTFNFAINYGRGVDGNIIFIDGGDIIVGQAAVEHERQREHLLTQDDFRWLAVYDSELCDYLRSQAELRLYS